MEIRESRPRVLMTPEVLARAKARAAAGDPSFVALRAHCRGYLSNADLAGFHAQDYALMSLLEPEDTRWATKAISLAMRYCDRGMEGAITKSGYNLRDYLPAVCVVYDWCHARLTPAQKLTMSTQLYQWAEWAWDPARPQAWGQKNPGSNFYHGFMFTWMVGLALHPLSVGPVLAEQARARFLSEVRPYLLTIGWGGYWLEGTNYGMKSSSRFMFTYLLAHMTATGEDFLTTTPFIAENVRAKVHLTTPDGSKMVPFGVQSGHRAAPVTDYDRTPMRISASYLEGEARDLAKDWIWKVEERPVAKELLWEEMLWGGTTWSDEPDPCYFYAEGSGVVTARTSWSADATMLAAICGPDLEGHQDRASGNFCLWAGGEWLIGPKRLWAGTGVGTESKDHNVILVDGRGQEPPASELPKRDVHPPAVEDTQTYTRLRMEAAAAYTRRKFPTPERVLERWERELIWMKPGFLLCSDRVVKLRPEQVITWQVHLPRQPITRPDGVIVMEGEGAELLIDFLGGEGYWTEVEHVPDALGGCWRLKRIAPAGKLTDEFNCLFQIKQ